MNERELMTALTRTEQALTEMRDRYNRLMHLYNPRSRNKVKKGLICCRNNMDCINCPYNSETEPYPHCETHLLDDAIHLMENNYE